MGWIRIRNWIRTRNSNNSKLDPNTEKIIPDQSHNTVIKI